MTNNNKGSEPKHQTPTKLKPVLTKHGVLYRPFAPIGIAPVLSQVAIGVACASYWRGCWYILDDNLFPDNNLHSATASLGLGTIGLAVTQGVIARQAEKSVASKKLFLPEFYTYGARFGTLYCVATSCILVWRGAWLGWDVAYEYFYKDSTGAKVKATDPGHLTNSGLLSHGIAIGGLLAFGRFSSVLAPPARASILSDLAMKARTWKEYSASAKWFFK